MEVDADPPAAPFSPEALMFSRTLRAGDILGLLATELPTAYLPLLPDHLVRRILEVVPVRELYERRHLYKPAYARVYRGALPHAYSIFPHMVPQHAMRDHCIHMPYAVFAQCRLLQELLTLDPVRIGRVVGECVLKSADMARAGELVYIMSKLYLRKCFSTWDWYYIGSATAQWLDPVLAALSRNAPAALMHISDAIHACTIYMKKLALTGFVKTVARVDANLMATHWLAQICRVLTHNSGASYRPAITQPVKSKVSLLRTAFAHQYRAFGNVMYLPGYYKIDATFASESLLSDPPHRAPTIDADLFYIDYRTMSVYYSRSPMRDPHVMFYDTEVDASMRNGRPTASFYYDTPHVHRQLDLLLPGQLRAWRRAEFRATNTIDKRFALYSNESMRRDTIALTDILCNSIFNMMGQPLERDTMITSQQLFLTERDWLTEGRPPGAPLGSADAPSGLAMYLNRAPSTPPDPFQWPHIEMPQGKILVGWVTYTVDYSTGVHVHEQTFSEIKDDQQQAALRVCLAHRVLVSKYREAYGALPLLTRAMLRTFLADTEKVLVNRLRLVGHLLHASPTLDDLKSGNLKMRQCITPAAYVEEIVADLLVRDWPLEYAAKGFLTASQLRTMALNVWRRYARERKMEHYQTPDGRAYCRVAPYSPFFLIFDPRLAPYASA